MNKMDLLQPRMTFFVPRNLDHGLEDTLLGEWHQGHLRPNLARMPGLLAFSVAVKVSRRGVRQPPPRA